MQCTRRRFAVGAVASIPLALSGCLGSEIDEPTVVIIDRSVEEEVADYHGHWHGGLPPVSVGSHISLGAVFTDEDGDEIPLDDGRYALGVEAVGETDVIFTESHGDHVHIHGEQSGETDVVFQLVAGDEPEWETSESIGVEVVDT